MTCFLGIASLVATTCFSCTFLLRGILSLAPTGLPRFKCGFDSFVAILTYFPTGTSIHVGVLAVGMWDFTIFLLSMNTPGK